MIEEVVKMDSAIETANDRLILLTEDEDARMAYRMRFKAMCDLTSLKNGSRREGFEKGLAKGRKEGILTTARNALAEGASVDFVQKITGLSLDAIERLNSRDYPDKKS